MALTITDRKKKLLELVAKLQSATATDIMRYIENDTSFKDGVEKHRFNQSIHAGLHTLYEEGKLDRPENKMKIDPDSGQRVYAYEIAAIGTKARVKQGEKQYKAKYEALLIEFEEIESRNKFMEMMVDKKNDEIAQLKERLKNCRCLTGSQ